MHLHGQPFGGVLENISFTSSFNGKKCKKKCEDKLFLNKMISQIKMHAATNWSNHLKKHQTFDFVSNDRYVFNAIFKNYIFRDF